MKNSFYSTILSILIVSSTSLQGMAQTEATIQLFSSFNSPSMETFLQAINNGADVNARTPQGASALHITSSLGLLDYVVLLAMNYNALLDAQDDMGRTPLFDAIHAGHNQIVSFLLRRGASPNLGAHEGSEFKTPIIKAIDSRNGDAVKLLIEANATTHGSETTMDPLRFAIIKGDDVIINLLLNHPQSFIKEEVRSQALATALLTQKTCLAERLAMTSLKMLLQLALTSDNVHLISKIHELDPDLSCMDPENSLARSPENLNINVVIGFLLSRVPSCVTPVLVTAARNNQRDLVVVLMCEESVDINAIHQGATALAAAAYQGNEEIVALLVGHPRIIPNPVHGNTHRYLLDDLREQGEDKSEIIKHIEMAIAQQKETPEMTSRGSFASFVSALRQGASSIIDSVRHASSASSNYKEF